MKQYISYYEAPFGLLLLCASEHAIQKLQIFYKYAWSDKESRIIFQKKELSVSQIHKRLKKELDFMNQKEEIFFEDTTLLKEAKQQLSEYFNGTRTTFKLPLETSGTSFQQDVWNALQEIPYGQTRSYKQIAQAIHNPKAVRAIGGANNKNPIFIIIPCHRVIGADGSMVGFGGGIEVKKYLLELEGYRKKEEKLCNID